MAPKVTLLLTTTLALLKTANATNATIAGYIDSQCNSEEQWSLQGTIGACISLAGQPEANSIVAQAPAGQEVILCSDAYCGNYTSIVTVSETYCYDEARLRPRSGAGKASQAGLLLCFRGAGLRSTGLGGSPRAVLAVPSSCS